ncbi:hypothetical protein DYB35_005659 [Aphanomyces astaci]|uniref:Uncharacterized protein n=1 Tax=Aphanomyces astaci TaxID=112090 RepID=A0A418DLQ9_APHAT|nr:hypothetical protein DYB35_005659 [Aphanomyces astaci]
MFTNIIITWSQRGRKTLAPSTSPVKPNPTDEKSVSVLYLDPIPTPDASTSLKATTQTVGPQTTVDVPPAYSVGMPMVLQTVPVVRKKRGDIEPKVFLPHERTVDQPPRQVEVERKKRRFEAADVGSLVGERLAQLFESAEYATVTSDTSGIALQLLEAMPLHWFDDKSFEVREAEKDGTIAIPVTALYGRPGVPNVWCEGHVIGFNANRRMFVVRFRNQGQDDDVQLHRNDAEDPMQFVERVVAAHKARLVAQSAIRKNVYIDCMPSDGLHKLGSENINKILKLASVPFVAKNIPVPDTARIVNEVHTDYLRTMSRIIFEHQQRAHPSPGMNFHLLADNGGDDDKKHVVTIQHHEVAPPIDYADQFIGFSFQTFLTSPETLAAVVKVNEECYRMLCMDVFALKTSRSLKLEEFQQRQNTQERLVHKIVHEDWPNKLTHAIKTSLVHVGKGWYNLQETRRDTYEFSKLRSFLRRVNLTMKVQTSNISSQDTLRYMSEQSLHSFRAFVDKATEANVKIIDAKTSFLSYADLDARRAELGHTKYEHLCRQRQIQNPPALFTVNLSVSSELIVINQAAIDDASRDIAQWKAEYEVKLKRLQDDDPDGDHRTL